MTKFGKDMTEKNACKNLYLGSIFVPEKHVGVFWKSSYEEDIQPEIQVLPGKIFMIRNLECKNKIEGSEEGMKEEEGKAL